MSKITLNIPDDLDVKLEEIEKRTGNSYRQTILTALTKYLLSISPSSGDLRESVRPKIYSKEEGEKIFERMTEMDQSGKLRTLTEICKDPDMPSIATVLSWRRDVPEFEKLMEDVKRVTIQVFSDKIFQKLQEMDATNVQTIKDTVNSYLTTLSKVDPISWGGKNFDNISGGGASADNIVFEIRLIEVTKQQKEKEQDLAEQLALQSSLD